MCEMCESENYDTLQDIHNAWEGYSFALASPTLLTFQHEFSFNNTTSNNSNNSNNNCNNNSNSVPRKDSSTLGMAIGMGFGGANASAEATMDMDMYRRSSLSTVFGSLNIRKKSTSPASFLAPIPSPPSSPRSPSPAVVEETQSEDYLHQKQPHQFYNNSGSSTFYSHQHMNLEEEDEQDLLSLQAQQEPCRRFQRQMLSRLQAMEIPASPLQSNHYLSSSSREMYTPSTPPITAAQEANKFTPPPSPRPSLSDIHLKQQTQQTQLQQQQQQTRLRTRSMIRNTKQGPTTPTRSSGSGRRVSQPAYLYTPSTSSSPPASSSSSIYSSPSPFQSSMTLLHLSEKTSNLPPLSYISSRGSDRGAIQKKYSSNPPSNCGLSSRRASFAPRVNGCSPASMGESLFKSGWSWSTA